MWFEEVLGVALLWKKGGGIVESGKHGRCRVQMDFLTGNFQIVQMLIFL